MNGALLYWFACRFMYRFMCRVDLRFDMLQLLGDLRQFVRVLRHIFRVLGIADKTSHC